VVQKIQACYEAADAITMPPESDWSADIREVKEMYVEKPGQVNACLKRIKVEALPEDELRRSVLELAHRLVVDEVIAYPAQVWSNHFDVEEDDDKDPSPEQIIRFGFLFIAYRVGLLVVRGSRDVKETAHNERSGLHQARYARADVCRSDDHLLLFTPRTFLAALLLINPQQY